MTTKAHAVTLGELVLFHEPASEGQPDPDPEVAIVCKVNEDGSVNLCAFTPTGTSRPVHAVPVLAKGGKAQAGHSCCPLAATKAESHAKESHPKDIEESHTKVHAHLHAKAETHPHAKGHGHGHK